MNTVVLRFLFQNTYLDVGMSASVADGFIKLWMDYESGKPEPKISGVCSITGIKWAVKASAITAMHTLRLQEQPQQQPQSPFPLQNNSGLPYR